MGKRIAIPSKIKALLVASAWLSSLDETDLCLGDDGESDDELLRAYDKLSEELKTKADSMKAKLIEDGNIDESTLDEYLAFSFNSDL